MAKAGSQPLDRLFYALVVGIGAVSSAVILLAFYFLTASFDRYATNSANENISRALDEWTSTLVASIEGYAFRDTAFQAVTLRDNNRLMSDLSEDPALDWVAILEADGTLITDVNMPKNWGAAEYLGSPTFAAILDQIAEGAPSEHLSIGGAFESNGTRFLAATARITPRDLSGVDGDALPFLIAGRTLDADTLKDITAGNENSDVSFSSSPTDRSVAVEGPLGVVGHLSWQAALPGSQFRQIALPWVLTLCAGLLLLAAWMGRYFRRLLNSVERLHRVATTDHLTGVANRSALTEMLHAPPVQEALQHGSLAVISLDLDDFKRLNDTHGHQAGDTALQLAADRISSQVRKHERVFRMGGDEFLCLVFDPDPKAAAEKVVARLRTAFSKPMDLGGMSQIVSPSIGVAIPHQGEAWDDVLERSDAAMYRAKRSELAHSFC